MPYKRLPRSCRTRPSRRTLQRALTRAKDLFSSERFVHKSAVVGGLPQSLDQRLPNWPPIRTLTQSQDWILTQVSCRRLRPDRLIMVPRLNSCLCQGRLGIGLVLNWTPSPNMGTKISNSSRSCDFGHDPVDRDRVRGGVPVIGKESTCWNSWPLGASCRSWRADPGSVAGLARSPTSGSLERRQQGIHDLLGRGGELLAARSPARGLR